MQRNISLSLIECAAGTVCFVLAIASAGFLLLPSIGSGWEVSCLLEAFLVGMLFFLLVGSTAGKGFYIRVVAARHRGVLYAAAGLPVALCVVGLWAATAMLQSFALAMCLAFLLGGCTVFHGVLWGGMWGLAFAVYEKPLCYVCVLLSFLAGFIGILLIAMFGIGFVSCAAVSSVCWVCSAALYGFICRADTALPFSSVDYKDAKQEEEGRTHMSLRSYSMGFIVAAFVPYMVEGTSPALCLAIFLAFACIGVALMLALFARTREIPSCTIESGVFFCIELAFVSLLVVPGQRVWLAVFGAAVGIYLVLYFIAICLTTGQRHLVAHVHFGLRIRKMLVGAILGLGIGLALFGFLAYGLASTVCVAACLVLLICNHLRDPHSWAEWGALYRYANEIEEGVSAADLGPRASTIVYWENTCAEIADRSGLSDREKEVFILLAKGRNAALIAEKLCISLNTARTHIYHVYSKTGLENQQRLISLVEEEQQAKKTEKKSQGKAEIS